MIDPLARRIVLPAMRRTGGAVVVAGNRETGRHDEILRLHRRRGRRHDSGLDRCLRIALVHHHPAHIVEHHLAALVDTGGAHPDDAARLVGILAQAQHRRMRRQRVAGIDRHAPAEFRVAEIGDGVQRDVRHRLADDDVEDEKVVERGVRQADRLREHVRRIDGEARPVERDVQRRIGLGQRARGGMAEFLPDAEILEEIAVAGLVHAPACSSLIAEASARARSACST